MRKRDGAKDKMVQEGHMGLEGVETLASCSGFTSQTNKHAHFFFFSSATGLSMFWSPAESKQRNDTLFYFYTLDSYT